jgi:predicted PurR-regulated permease PerM
VSAASTEPTSYTGRVVVAVAIFALAFLLWHLLHVVIIGFGAVLVASALYTLATPLRERVGLPPRLALIATVLLLVAVIGGGATLLGEQIAGQIGALRDELPRALDALMGWLGRNPIGRTFLELWNNAKETGVELTRVAGLATMTLSAVGSALLIVFAGIYLAADPQLYRRGALHLLPQSQRARVDDALRAAAAALSRWLLGQAVSMAAIGTLTTIGLWVIGMPLALTLGIITGALAFVPFFGATVAGVLVVLLAFTQGPQMAFAATVLFIGVQQAEEFLVLPFVQRWAVRLPPVLGLMSVLIFSLLFGPLGALFATPLMVVALVLIQKLYVKGVVENGSAPRPAQSSVAR